MSAVSQGKVEAKPRRTSIQNPKFISLKTKSTLFHGERLDLDL